MSTDIKAQPIWPSVPEDHPLSLFRTQLPSILESANYSEVYGLTLTIPPNFHTNIIIQKFLRANANDVEKAKNQLLETLKWRKEFRPLEAKKEVHDKNRFDGLGWVTVLEGKEGREVVTWNIYGAVKDNKLTFEDIDG